MQPLAEKAAALGCSLALHVPFLDGNKRVAHAAREAFLVLDGHQLQADVDDAERTMLALAAGTAKRERFTACLTARLVPLVPRRQRGGESWSTPRRCIPPMPR